MKTFLVWLEDITDQQVRDIIKIAQANPGAKASKVANLARKAGINVGWSRVSQILNQSKSAPLTQPPKPKYKPAPLTQPLSPSPLTQPLPVKTPKPAAPTINLEDRYQVLKYIRNAGEIGLMKLGHALKTLASYGIIKDTNDYEAIDFNSLGHLMRDFTPTGRDIDLIKIGLEYQKNNGILPWKIPGASPTGEKFTYGSISLHHGRGREINPKKGFQVKTPEEERDDWMKYVGDEKQTSWTPDDKAMYGGAFRGRKQR